MTNNQCGCSGAGCLHETCPLPDAQPPFDEVVHEVDDNFISVRIPKNTGEYQPENVPKKDDDLTFDFNCTDADGVKCKSGCNKVHVIQDVYAPEKTPEEEMLSLKAIRHAVTNDDIRTTLEIEFRAPRNYIPLPELGPTPPIIVPKQPPKKKGKRKKKKKKRGTGRARRYRFGRKASQRY